EASPGRSPGWRALPVIARFHGGNFGRAALAPDRVVAMGKAPETRDHSVMTAREGPAMTRQVAIDGEALQLVRYMLRMHQRHGQELARQGGKPAIIFSRQRSVANAAGQRIESEGAGTAPIKVARELVEQQDR